MKLKFSNSSNYEFKNKITRFSLKRGKIAQYLSTTTKPYLISFIMKTEKRKETRDILNEKKVKKV